MNGVTFLLRQEGKGSKERDPVFSKIKNAYSGPSRWEEEGMSEDANMHVLWQDVEGLFTDVFYFSVGVKVTWRLREEWESCLLEQRRRFEIVASQKVKTIHRHMGFLNVIKGPS